MKLVDKEKLEELIYRGMPTREGVMDVVSRVMKVQADMQYWLGRLDMIIALNNEGSGFHDGAIKNLSKCLVEAHALQSFDVHIDIYHAEQLLCKSVKYVTDNEKFGIAVDVGDTNMPSWRMRVSYNTFPILYVPIQGTQYSKLRDWTPYKFRLVDNPEWNKVDKENEYLAQVIFD